MHPVIRRMKKSALYLLKLQKLSFQSCKSPNPLSRWCQVWVKDIRRIIEPSVARDWYSTDNRAKYGWRSYKEPSSRLFRSWPCGSPTCLCFSDTFNRPYSSKANPSAPKYRIRNWHSVLRCHPTEMSFQTSQRPNPFLQLARAWYSTDNRAKCGWQCYEEPFSRVLRSWHYGKPLFF